MNRNPVMRPNVVAVCATRILLLCLLWSPLFIGSPAFAHSVTGAIWTSLDDGATVNGNLYDNKDDVYLNGGPPHEGAAGLPTSLDPDNYGIYVFQVTDPSGATLLSSDDVECRQFTVGPNGRINGVVVTGCQHPTGTDVDTGSTTIQLMPYDDTPNNGGEYKVWITPLSDLADACSTTVILALDFGRRGKPSTLLENCAGTFGFVGGHIKTDNFKVRINGNNPNLGSITCAKYYDANNNGDRDVDEAGIAGWPIKICRTSAGSGPSGSIADGECQTTCTGTLGECSFTDLGAGTYLLREARARDIDSDPANTSFNVFDWMQTEPIDPATTTLFGADDIDTAGTFDEDLMNGIYGASIDGTDVTGLEFGNVATEQAPVCGGLTWGYWKTHTGTDETPSQAPIDPVYEGPLDIDLGESGGTHLDVDNAEDADTVFSVDGNGTGDEPPWSSPQEIGDLCSSGDCRTNEFSYPADCSDDCHEQLVVQLLALKLNVLSGEFSGDELYINPGDPNSGKTVNEIIADADEALSDWFDGGSFDFGPLQSTIDAINNNGHTCEEEEPYGYGVLYIDSLLDTPPTPLEFVGGVTCP